MQLRPFLDSLLPPRLSSRNSNPFALLWRHGRQAPFAADLAALATDSSHVRREVNGLGGSWFFGVWLGDLSGSRVHDELRKLVGISGALTLSNRHTPMMAQLRC